MGQYWMLINLDKRQTFGHWGKLFEFITDWRPSDVVPYLTIPLTAIPDTVENGHLIGSWAGDRIICVGDYVDARDYPDGLFTEDEIKDAEGEDMYSIAWEYYDTVTPIQLPPPEDAFGHNKVWILRNLSKREFVRVDALRAKTSNIRGPVVLRGDPSLGDAVLSRICWSSNEDGTMGLCEGMSRGVWAGDRFDIRLIDTVVNDHDEGWKDVSDEIAEDVATNFM